MRKISGYYLNVFSTAEHVSSHFGAILMHMANNQSAQQSNTMTLMPWEMSHGATKKGEKLLNKMDSLWSIVDSYEKLSSSKFQLQQVGEPREDRPRKVPDRPSVRDDGDRVLRDGRCRSQTGRSPRTRRRRRFRYFETFQIFLQGMSERWKLGLSWPSKLIK